MRDHSERRQVTRAAGVVGFATLLSRVGGFVRDLVTAYLFGASPAADAFFVAFRIPNLLRRLFAEGSLTVAFIPIFTEELTTKGKPTAFRLARATGTMLAMIVGVVTLLGIWLAPWVVRFTAPGFVPGDGTYTLTVLLTRWCFPFIFLISLTALAAGVLNSLGRFFAPAVATALFNVAMIIAALTLSGHLDPPVMSLAVGVLVGGALTVLLQVPYLKRLGVGLAPLWDPANPALKRILRLMGPAAFGAAVYQINTIMNTMLASLLPTGSVSYLYYADRLMEFPLGIFAVAVGTAILPSLSRRAAAKDTAGIIDTMGFGLRLTMFINLPAMVGLVVLAEPLITLLFRRGHFGAESVGATAWALVGYGVGLWAVAGLRTMVQTFYALKDTRTPVKVGVICLVINLASSVALMWPLAHVGLALATSLTSICNLLILAYLLRRKLGRLGGGAIWASAWRCLVASMVMGGLCALVAYGPDWGDHHGLAYGLARPVTALFTGVVAYAGLAYAWRLRELRELWEVVRGR